MTAQERLALFFTEYGTQMSLVHLSLTASLRRCFYFDVAADLARNRMRPEVLYFFLGIIFEPSCVFDFRMCF